jgi:hypothetical protein
VSRDQQLDRALKQELRAMGTPAGDHIDAETLAAWADGGLDAIAMASVESHVSSCPRCQAIAAVMTHSAPVVAAEPRRAFRIPAWWYPIAAGAAAVTIWMVVPQQREIATAPPAPPAAAAPSINEERPAEVARDSIAPGQGKDRAPARDDRRERGAVAENAPHEPSAKLQDSAVKEDADASKRLQQKNEIAGAAPAAAPAAPALRAPAAIGELQKGATFAAAAVEVISPNASRRWRVVLTGIERSEDGGRTWVVVRSATADAITSGVAPTESICWLIGRAGIVLVTTDGITFARVPLPEAIDLTNIAATDARSATVTTVDGRRFRTDDSGRTWRPI